MVLQHEHHDLSLYWVCANALVSPAEETAVVAAGRQAEKLMSAPPDHLLASCAERLSIAADSLKRGKIWTAYSVVREIRRSLYLVEVNLAHKSPRAASDWGCAMRLPNGKIAIIEDPF